MVFNFIIGFNNLYNQNNYFYPVENILTLEVTILLMKAFILTSYLTECFGYFCKAITIQKNGNPHNKPEI